MARSGDRPSSFFMFCFGDFSSKLTIPKAFAKTHRDFFRQVSINLRNEFQKSWDVKIKSIDGDFHITDGWSDFVKGNNLTHMKLLVFHINGDSTLKVSIFGHDSCLELETNPSNHQRSLSFVKEFKKSASGNHQRSLSFVKEFKKYNERDQRMDLPKGFVEQSGIWRSMKMELENSRGERWAVKVTDRNKEMYNMSGGWSEFAKGNNLKVGTRLLFEFVPASNNVVKVVEVESSVLV